MVYVNGVNLLPSTGEFTYGTVARQGQRVTETELAGINYYYNNSPSAETDYSVSIDQLAAQFVTPAPAANKCTTVAVVVAWFGNSTNITECQIYPSTTYINGSFQKWNGSGWSSENWQCSSLTQSSSGLIPISQTNGTFTYGGTPSDQSIVECIADLKSRGFRVVFYPFVLMDDGLLSWRGQIAYESADVSAATTTAVNSFLGSAVPADFTPDYVNETVAYSGPATDYTFRRMILHYANLCVVAGGVELFLIGSEFRGLESIRGPGWTINGTGNPAIWDYPFIAGLIQLSDDVRSVFDSAGYHKDTVNLHNLIAYSADWSSWTGIKHDNANPPTGVLDGAQWPHLDQLFAHNNIDIVSFDNYLPLSDWTTYPSNKNQNQQLDVLNWLGPVPTVWPPSPATMSGLGLTGTPTIYSKPYLKANIEGGERFNWFYFDSNNLGRGLDPNGTGLQVSLPEGDRLTQSRNQYYSNQQILGQKQLRWWWNNQHYPLYDSGDGQGLIPRGNPAQWVPASKSITFAEYGVPSTDKATNQPNVFFSPGSIQSNTAFWSIWDPSDGGAYLPRADQNLQLLALEAIYEYWFTDTPSHNEEVAGVIMLQPAFCSVWNWDARPLPIFPWYSNVWSDAANWRTGNWLNGKGPFIPLPVIDQPPEPPVPFQFPTLPGLTWSVHKRPLLSTRVASHVSGREVRTPFYSQALYEFELTIEGLDSLGNFPGLGIQSLQSLMGLFLQCQGQFDTFLYIDSSDTVAIDVPCGVGNGVTTSFTLQRSIGYDNENISWVTGVSSVYLNGVALPQYKLIEDSSNGQHFAWYEVLTSQPAGTSITFSAYIKAGERSSCFLQIFNGSQGIGCGFNLPTVTATEGSGVAASSITAAPNGWYLCSMTATMAIGNFPAFYIFTANPAGTASYAGTPGSGIYMSAPMVSVGNVAAAPAATFSTDGSELIGPNWTLTQPNTLTFANAPLGAPTAAYHLIEDGSTGNHLTQQSVPSQALGSLITFTCYVQAGERSACRLNFYNGSATIGCDFNLASVAAGTPDAGITTASINQIGGGWFQLQIAGVMAAAAGPIFYILLENPYETTSYTGSPGSGIYFSGANWQVGYGAPAALPPFATTPGASIVTIAGNLPGGVAISADCTYGFNCRFLDDQEDFEQFMSGLWKVESLKFRSVKP
jgi:hypothetical protein